MADLDGHRVSYRPLQDGKTGQSGPSSVGMVAVLVSVTAAFILGRQSATSGGQAVDLAPTFLAAAGQTLFEPHLSPAYDAEPLAKHTVRKFDAFLMSTVSSEAPEKKYANVKQWLSPDFEYETVGFPSSKTLAGWVFSGEEKHYKRTFPMSVFNQMLFFGTEEMATTTTYGTVYWSEPLFDIPAAHDWVYFRVLDFYAARRISPTQGHLYYNFMMMDFADLFRRVGRPVLPKAALPEGFVMTAAADDGVPAPLSVMAKKQDVATAQRMAEAALHADWVGDGPGAQAWHANLTFYGPGGVGTARGVDQYREHVLKPFRAAFANRSLTVKIFGCEGNYCGAFGEVHGRHVAPWLGLEASSKVLSVRFGFHWRVQDGLVQEGWAIFDVPGLFKQLGLDFFAIAAGKPRLD